MNLSRTGGIKSMFMHMVFGWKDNKVARRAASAETLPLVQQIGSDRKWRSDQYGDARYRECPRRQAAIAVVYLLDHVSHKIDDQKGHFSMVAF